MLSISQWHRKKEGREQLEKMRSVNGGEVYEQLGAYTSVMGSVFQGTCAPGLDPHLSSRLFPPLGETG